MTNAFVHLFCAIAQQCFINEYIFAQSDEETRHSSELRDLLLKKAGGGAEITHSFWPRLRPISRFIPSRGTSAVAPKVSAYRRQPVRSAAQRTVGGSRGSGLDSGADHRRRPPFPPSHAPIRGKPLSALDGQSTRGLCRRGQMGFVAVMARQTAGRNIDCRLRQRSACAHRSRKISPVRASWRPISACQALLTPEEGP